MTSTDTVDRIVDYVTALHWQFSMTSPAEGVSHIHAVVDDPTMRKADGRPQLTLDWPSPSLWDRSDGVAPAGRTALLVNWYAAVVRAEPSRRPWAGRLHGILVYRTDDTIPETPAGLFDPALLPPMTTTSELYLLDGRVASVTGIHGTDTAELVGVSRLDELDNADEVLAPDNWFAPVIAAIRGTPVPQGRIRAFADHLGVAHRSLTLAEATEAILEHTLDRVPPVDGDGLVGPVGARIPAGVWDVLIDVVYHPYDLDAVLAGHTDPTR